MSDIVNPYIAGSPVTGSAMFFGREDVFQYIHRALIGQHRDNVIILYGQRRTGKTSVLYQMRTRLDPRYLCIFLDMHGFALEGLGGFLWELTAHILRDLRRYYQLKFSPPDRAAFFADPRHFFEHEFLAQLWSDIGERHLLLMLDEVIYLEEQVQAGKLGHEIFEYMRYLMQHYERLNFLFSLGSGLEELEKEYAFLFNVGLYKRISFLEQDAAADLITQPVKDIYQVAPAAVERIYHMTSGHPYYTQLLCHSLFNRWQQHQAAYIEVDDVDNVFDEAVERGSAVLKYNWEELSTGEKAIVAGMVTAMGERTSAVGIKDIDRVWHRYNVTIPEGEQAKAMRNLLARDIIVGKDRYTFTVDLLRLWVQKYQRMEWVKEEISTFWSQPSTPKRNSWPFNPFVTRVLAIGMVLLVLLGVSSRLFYVNDYLPHQQQANVTATAQAVGTREANANATTTAVMKATQNPYPPHHGSLLLNTPLNKNTKDSIWNEGIVADLGSCQFTGGAYHAVILQSDQFWYCEDTALTVSDFAYQAQMTILKGEYGGLSFRAGTSGFLYYFYISATGTYELDIDRNHQFIRAISSGSSSAIRKGYNQPNLLGVVAQGNSFDLYINLQHIAHAKDSTFSSGQVGILVKESTHPTEAAFQYAKVWKL
jgi:hypothetical protein